MLYQLLILLCICHWIGDYTQLQTAWMLQAKAVGKPLLPILTHALVHGALMSIVLFFFTDFRTILTLFVFQVITHFITDVWKGKMNIWFPKIKNPTQQVHWVIFGFDQLVHHVVIVLMVWYIFPV